MGEEGAFLEAGRKVEPERKTLPISPVADVPEEKGLSHDQKRDDEEKED